MTARQQERAAMSISDHEKTAEAMLDLASLAMNFSRIKRTGVCHSDGTPETDGDHTVMLTWLAPSLANLCGNGELDVARVAELAAVHDAAEVLAGDTPTINITDQELGEKADREYVATRKITSKFYPTLDRFALALQVYEDQQLPEARFVRAVDKLMPKLVHLLDNCVGVRLAGTTREMFAEMAKRQRQQVARYASEWPDLFLLHIELCDRVLALPAWDETLPLVPQPTHQLHTRRDGTWMVEHHLCEHDDPNVCPFTLAASRWYATEAGRLPLTAGVFRMGLDDWGEMILVTSMV